MVKKWLKKFNKMDNTLRIILFQFYILIIYSVTIFGQNIDNDTM